MTKQGELLPRESKETFPKHNNAIHIGVKKSSLLERKLANALLYQSYENLLTSRYHTINLSILCALVGYRSKDLQGLKRALRSLQTTLVEWDVLGADNAAKGWRSSTLLASVEFSRGVCTFEYSGMLAESLYHPDKYSLIDLAVQRQFKSGYALALYENCFRFKDTGSTGFWTIEQFKILLGIDELKAYSEFKELNSKVIKKTVKEVNDSSDITIKPFFTREGRTVIGLRFDVSKKSANKANALPPDKIESLDVYKQLIASGVSRTLARKAIEEQGAAHVTEQLAIVSDMESAGKIKTSPKAVLQDALKKGGYEKNNENKQAEALQKKQEKAAKDAARAKQKRELEKKKIELQKSYRAVFSAGATSIYNSLEAAEQQATFDAILAKCTGLQKGDFRKKLFGSVLAFAVVYDYMSANFDFDFPTREQFYSDNDIDKIEAEIAKL